MLELQRYDFIVNFFQGKEAVIPDTQSRVYSNDCETEISTEDMKAQVYFINKSLPMTKINSTLIVKKNSNW